MPAEACRIEGEAVVAGERRIALAALAPLEAVGDAGGSPRSVAFKAAIASELRAKVWPLLERGVVRPVVHASFPLAQASSAHALMESSAHIGKIILSV